MQQNKSISFYEYKSQFDCVEFEIEFFDIIKKCNQSKQSKPHICGMIYNNEMLEIGCIKCSKNTYTKFYYCRKCHNFITTIQHDNQQDYEILNDDKSFMFLLKVYIFYSKCVEKHIGFDNLDQHILTMKFVNKCCQNIIDGLDRISNNMKKMFNIDIPKCLTRKRAQQCIKDLLMQKIIKDGNEQYLFPFPTLNGGHTALFDVISQYAY
jgi:hypothetical protein